MAAFVVLPAPAREETSRPGARLNIFPGSATPAVMTAGAPFWIGYGFVPEPSETDPEGTWARDEETRFELLVDGRGVSLDTDMTIEGGRTLSKLSVAAFPGGLPAGWHRFSGRWYEAGSLVLTSERSIEFVER
jgi:hypothetical protein